MSRVSLILRIWQAASDYLDRELKFARDHQEQLAW